ncbi:AAA family ATPase [Nitrososphaera sp.]|uniref:AAA family ATPase n=1 Tax=Nitrososphaera sp. TaxID=1971748 RepID=UPI00307D9A12
MDQCLMDSKEEEEEEEERAAGESEVLLKLMGNKVNARIITLLRRQPLSPRDLSRYLDKKEGDVVRRLKAMERHGLVKGSWGTRLGQNVKLYSLTTHDISVKLARDGLQVRYSGKGRAEGRKVSAAKADAESGVGEPSAAPYDASPIVGRGAELKLLSDSRASFFFISGIAGIGKTSLARKFVQQQQQQQQQEAGASRVFWHTFKEIDTLAYLVGRLALFLSKNGAGGLLSHLDDDDESAGRGGSNNNGVAAATGPESLEILTADLNRLRNCILVFDDYHRVRDEKISVLLRHLQLKLEPGNKALVLSRSKPPFFLDNARSKELTLSGLPLDESEEMLSSFRIGDSADVVAAAGKSSSAVNGIWKRFAGHPMAMKMFCMLAREREVGGGGAGETKKPPENISAGELLAYFRKEILELLSQDELSVLMSLSVFRTPVRIGALRPGVQGKRNLNHLIYSLEKKMLVSRTAAGQEFFLHDMLREALYSMLAYPEEAHEPAALYYLSQNTAEGVVESLYHLVRCQNIARIAAILAEEVAEEKYRFLEEGYAAPLVETLGQISASRIASGSNKKDWLVYLYNIEGKALSMLERWQEGRERLDAALGIARELGDELLIAYSQKTLSEALYLRGDFQAAERHLVEAAAAFQRHGMQKPLKNAYMKLARLCFATGRLEESKSYSDMAK